MSLQETGKNRLLHVLFSVNTIIIVKEELYGSNFILVTPSGECITVLLPDILPSHHIHIPYLVKTPKRLMNKEEYESLIYFDVVSVMKSHVNISLMKHLLIWKLLKWKKNS